MRAKRILSIFLIVLSCLLLFTACAGEYLPSWELNKFTPDGDIEILYLYGVVRSKGDYYACVLTEYREEPDDGELLHVPLAKELDASFQQDGWIGAWSPVQYDTAKALAKAYDEGMITPGSDFYFRMTDGYMDYLAEKNYYNGIPDGSN